MHRQFSTEARARHSAVISGLRNAALMAFLLAGIWAPTSAQRRRSRRLRGAADQISAVQGQAARQRDQPAYAGL